MSCICCFETCKIRSYPVHLDDIKRKITTKLTQLSDCFKNYQHGWLCYRTKWYLSPVIRASHLRFKGTWFEYHSSVHDKVWTTTQTLKKTWKQKQTLRQYRELGIWYQWYFNFLFSVTQTRCLSHVLSKTTSVFLKPPNHNSDKKKFESDPGATTDFSSLLFCHIRILYL